MFEESPDSGKKMVANGHGVQAHGKCHRDNTNPADGKMKGEKCLGVLVK